MDNPEQDSMSSDTSARAKNNQSINSKTFVGSSLEESKSSSNQSIIIQSTKFEDFSRIQSDTQNSMAGNSEFISTLSLGPSFAASSRDRPGRVEHGQHSMTGLSLISPVDDGNENNYGEIDTIDTPADDQLGLRDYQLDIYRQIEKRWFEPNQPDGQYGAIIFMATGSGKTFIAIMLILRMFGSENDRGVQLEDKHEAGTEYDEENTIKSLTGNYTRLTKLSNQELINKRDQDVKPDSKKVVFMVPTTNLVEQQGDAISTFTPLKVGKYSGNHVKAQKQNDGASQKRNWQNQLKSFDVFVFTEKKFYDCLMHGFLKLSDFDLVIFDECHHADSSHYYNLIMQDFFYFKRDPSNLKPRILGLTASPIKSKIGECDKRNISSDIQEKLQNLSNNLYSQFVCISPQQIIDLEKQQARVIIEQFEFDLDDKVAQIKLIVEELIIKLCQIIKLDIEKMKIEQKGDRLIQNTDPSVKAREVIEGMDLSEQLEFSMEKIIYEEFESQQDSVVVKFLKQRSEFMQVDMKYIKSNIRIESFKDKNDQLLMIFSIIMLKNANNLILELGSCAFMNFLEDNRGMLDQMSESSSKTPQAREILSRFTLFGQGDGAIDQAKSVSNKVKRLVHILNQRIVKGKGGMDDQPPKVIIFVKDRVVAKYLQKILKRHVELREEKREKGESSVDAELLSQLYKVDVAMGPQGKNLVNKAYRSTKGSSSEVASTQEDSQFHSSIIESSSDAGSSGYNSQSSQSFEQDIRQVRGVGLQNVSQSSSNSVKMTNRELKDVLLKFRTGEVNILIATNVVEEGLDVSECNLVICMNEMMNVKAFIQMKGRARKKDSNFIFLSANQEFAEAEREKKNYGVIIDKMKELAFGEGIKPESNILEQKTVDESEYFEIQDTGAKVSLRDAKSLLETFCKAAQELQPYIHFKKPEADENPTRKMGKYVKDFEPYYKTSETEPQQNRKYFITCVYLPKSCGTYVQHEYRQMPLQGFSKKRDSENHAALQAIIKLYNYGRFDEYLFPKIGEWLDKSTMTLTKAQKAQISMRNNQIQQQQKKKSENPVQAFQNPAKFPSGVSYYAPAVTRKKALITPEEAEEFKAKQRDFERELKTNRSRRFEIVEESFRSLIKEKLFGDRVYEAMYGSSQKTRENTDVCVGDGPNQTVNEAQNQKSTSMHQKMDQKHSKGGIESQASLEAQRRLDEKKLLEKLPTIYIHSLKGQTGDAAGKNNGYPFKTTNDHLGIIFDRKFDQTNSIRFWMFQEKRQRDKNMEYLNQLKDNEIITQNSFDEAFQENDMIELELNKKNLIEIDFSKICSTLEEVKLCILKLKFFHTWVFYYFYCADHKFIKNIFKSKYTFVQMLFGDALNQIYRREQFCKNVKKIYCPAATDEAFERKYKSRQFYGHKPQLEICPYIVPLVEENQKLQINWKLINKVVKYIEKKMFDVVYCIKSHDIIQKNYNVDRTEVKKTPEKSFKTTSGSALASQKDMIGIWDDKFTGVRYVKLESCWSNQKWDYPILHLERRSGQFGAGNSIKKIGVQVVENFQETSQDTQQRQALAQANQNNFPNQSERQKFKNADQRLDIYTVQQYNFDKYGLFLNRKYNKKQFIVRKERHFVDFSKTPKQIEYDKANTSQATLQAMEEQKLQKNLQLQVDQPVSSRFDVTQELVLKCPLTYSQYQVFQQSCTHLLYFNEFLQVEKFIRDKFKDLKCFLEMRDAKDMLNLRTIQEQQNLSIDQKISQQKENLQSEMQPSSKGRDIFTSPSFSQNLKLDGNVVHTSAESQLLNNVDLMMEALTAPNANRNYDYERLEFYGDSVISFLVILELFLTKDYEYKEGPLDFYRIKQVSNMQFYEINLQQNFYKYMINEPQTIFNDFVPGAFENCKYQERIKHKTLNELNNKVKELRKIEAYLCSEEAQRDQDLLANLRTYFSEIGFKKKYLQNMHKDKDSDDYSRNLSSFAEDQIYIKKEKQDYTDKEMIQFYRKKLQKCIEKIQNQKQMKIEEISANQKKSASKRVSHQKMFFFKQLADVVESVTGAATVACGLNLTQDYLCSINVLKFKQEHLYHKLKELKRRKEGNKDTQAFVKNRMKDPSMRMGEVEGKIGYKFKNQLWMVEALTHKSYIDQNKSELDVYASYSVNEADKTVNSSYGNADQEIILNDYLPTDDYERLEFLGDAILNFLIAEHFYSKTVNDKEKKMPKELHKMKTSVINNALLSLIVIENGIDQHVLYNNKAISFRDQFNNYVSKVKELLAQVGGRTKGSTQALEIDQLYEYNLKIFGDVFESLIGAVFIDSESIEITWSVLRCLMEPYIKIYADLSTLQDHSRTKLLELWNQKPFMRNLKCHHETRKQDQSSESKIIFQGMVDDACVFEVPYNKDDKNKVRSFYKKYYNMILGFFQELEKKNGENLFLTKESIITRIQQYSAKHKKQLEEQDGI